MPLSRLGYSADRIATIAEAMFDDGEPHVSKKPSADRWSTKEILGHLVDSACVNLRRFLMAQCKDDLFFETYDHERWVHLQHYNDSDWEELVTLWASLNMHLCHVVTMISEAQLDKPRAEHNLHEICYREHPRDTPGTLGFLIEDYFAHLEHHMRQIMGDIPD